MNSSKNIYRSIIALIFITSVIGIFLVIIRPDTCNHIEIGMHVYDYLLGSSLLQLFIYFIYFYTYLKIEDKITNPDKNVFLLTIQFLSAKIYAHILLWLIEIFSLIWFVLGIVVFNGNNDCFSSSGILVYTLFSWIINIFISLSGIYYLILYRRQ